MIFILSSFFASWISFLFGGDRSGTFLLYIFTHINLYNNRIIHPSLHLKQGVEPISRSRSVLVFRLTVASLV